MMGCFGLDLVPFIGTTAVARMRPVMKNELKPVIQKALLGFEAGSWWLFPCGLY